MRTFNILINTSAKSINNWVKAAVVLHNCLGQTESAAYCPSGYIDSEDCSGNIQPGYQRGRTYQRCLQSNSQELLSNVQPLHGSWYTENLVAMRDGLTDYVNGEEGSTSWQSNYVRRA